jgi:protein-disulfide isomerase
MTMLPQIQTGRLTVPVDGRDHIRGAVEAPVTLVEYGDYQCPYCRRAQRMVQDVLRMRPTTLRLVFRHFPLTNAHPNAELAAEVAEAAARRGRFWQMHDWLFEHQTEPDPVPPRRGVEQVGLVPDEVEREIADHLHLDRIRRDFVGGVRSGVSGTPTFFVNGVRHDRGYTLHELRTAVDAAGAV